MRCLLTMIFMALIASYPGKLFASCSCTCCECVTFAYDDAGNRISRDVIDLSCMKEPPDTSDKVTENHEPGEIDPELAQQAIHEEESSGDQLQTGNSDHVFNLYPNPTRGKVVIEAEPAFTDKPGSHIRVYDMQGRELFNQEIEEQYFTIDFSPYAEGSYLVYFIAEGYEHDVKVIVN